MQKSRSLLFSVFLCFLWPRLVHAQDLSPELVFQPVNTIGAQAMAFSPDGSTFIWGTPIGEVFAWSLKDETIRRVALMKVAGEQDYIGEVRNIKTRRTGYLVSYRLAGSLYNTFFDHHFEELGKFAGNNLVASDVSHSGLYALNGDFAGAYNTKSAVSYNLFHTRTGESTDFPFPVKRTYETRGGMKIGDWDNEVFTNGFHPDEKQFFLKHNAYSFAVYSLPEKKQLGEVKLKKALAQNEGWPRPELRFLQYSGDGQSLCAVSERGVFRMWSSADLRQEKEFSTGVHDPAFFQISPDRRFIVLASEKGEAQVWDVEKEKQVSVFRTPTDKIKALAQHPSDPLYVVSDGFSLFFVDLLTGQVFNRFQREGVRESDKEDFVSVNINAGDRYLYARTRERTFIWDLATLSLVNTYFPQKGHSGNSHAGSFPLFPSHSGRYLFDGHAVLDIHSLQKYDFDWPQDGKMISSWYNSGTLHKPFAYNLEWFFPVSFHLPQKEVFPQATAIRYQNPTFVVQQASISNFEERYKPWAASVAGVLPDGQSFRVDGNKLVVGGKTWETGHAEAIVALAATSDGRQLVTAAANELKLWDVAERKELFMIQILRDGNFLLTNPKGYYTCSLPVTELLSFQVDGKDYALEQFDLARNRPEKILATLPQADPDALALYEKLHQLRCRSHAVKSADDLLTTDLPQVTITNREEIPLFSAVKEIPLSITATTGSGPLQALKVWVNNVPLAGRTGILLSGTDGQPVRQELLIPLSGGKNRIQVSAVNDRGLESIKESVVVYYNQPVSGKKALVVTAGVSRYRDAAFNLNYAAKDSEEMSRLLREALDTRREYQIETVNLVNEDFNLSKLKELEGKVQTLQPDDLLFFFYAGHGLINDELDYFLGAYGVNFDDPADGGVAFAAIEELLYLAPARKKMVLIDACHSGELEKTDAPETQAAAKVINTGTVQFRGFPARGIVSAAGKTPQSVSFRLLKENFLDFRKGAGAFVLSAAGGGEYAYESDEISNGVFTYAVKEGVGSFYADQNKNYEVSVLELATYAAARVEELTEGRQKPTIRGQNLSQDLILVRRLNLKPSVREITGIAGGKVIEYSVGDQTWQVVHAFGGERVFDRKSGDYLQGMTWEQAVGTTANAPVRGACPSGWHIPSREEWEILRHFCDGGNTCEVVELFPEKNVLYWSSSQDNGLPEAYNSSGFMDVVNPEDKLLFRCVKD